MGPSLAEACTLLIQCRKGIKAKQMHLLWICKEAGWSCFSKNDIVLSGLLEGRKDDRKHLLWIAIFKQTVTDNLHARILKQLANVFAVMMHSRAK